MIDPGVDDLQQGVKRLEISVKVLQFAVKQALELVAKMARINTRSILEKLRKTNVE